MSAAAREGGTLPPDHPVEAWYAALDAGDDGAAAALLARGFVAHQAGMDADAILLGRMRAGLRAGLPDLRVEHEVLHAAPGFVTVATWTRGTHTGPFMGHPPSGRAFRAAGLDAFRLEGGRIAEMWAAFDAEGMLRQLGLRGPGGPGAPGPGRGRP